MATVDFTSIPSDSIPLNQSSGKSNRQSDKDASRPAYHRIRTVRLQQGVSLRTAARHTGTDVRQLRRQEDESNDLRVSELMKWQKALDVPLSELLEEPDAPLSRPVMERAQMLRLMKTAVALQEQAPNASVKRMANMLIDQIRDVMPELTDVSGWHTFGQRRSLDEMGRVAENPIPDNLFD